MISFTNLKTPRNTATGIAERVLIALTDWFVPGGIKSPGNWGTAGDDVIIYDDHEFKTGLGFITCTLAPDKNSYDAKTIGDTGFNKFANEVKVMIPGSYAEEHEEITRLAGQPCIILIQDANCLNGQWYQVGTECVPARISASFTTGNSKEGNKGYLLSAVNTAEKVYLYQGDITHYGDDTPLPLIARITADPPQPDGINYIVKVYADTSQVYGAMTYQYVVYYQKESGSPPIPPSYTLPGNTDFEFFNTENLIDWDRRQIVVVLTISNASTSDTTLYTDPVDQQPLLIRF